MARSHLLAVGLAIGLVASACGGGEVGPPADPRGRTAGHGCLGGRPHRRRASRDAAAPEVEPRESPPSGFPQVGCSFRPVLTG